MKQADQFKRANQHILKLVERIENSIWDKSTPDTSWNIRQLVNHIVNENMWLRALFTDETIEEVGDRFDGDLLGSDPKHVVKRVIQESIAVVSDPVIVSKNVQLSFGKTPGPEYVNQMILDSVVHGWDLAAAMNADRRLEPELVKASWEYLRPKAEEWRNAGAFGPAYRLNTDQKDNLQNRLIAITGRNPDWHSKS